VGARVRLGYRCLACHHGAGRTAGREGGREEGREGRREGRRRIYLKDIYLYTFLSKLQAPTLEASLARQHAARKKYVPPSLPPSFRPTLLLSPSQRCLCVFWPSVQYYTLYALPPSLPPSTSSSSPSPPPSASHGSSVGSVGSGGGGGGGGGRARVIESGPAVSCCFLGRGERREGGREGGRKGRYSQPQAYDAHPFTPPPSLPPTSRPKRRRGPLPPHRPRS